MNQLLVHTKNGEIVALVDETDYERLNRYRWALHPRGYPICFVQGVGRRGRGIKGPGQYVMLHRMVLELVKGDGIVVDHINGDKLDNRRANLRAGTQTDNQQNRTSGYGRSRHRGVGWDENRQKWIASAKLPHMTSSKFLGRFADEEEAARVAAAYRAEHMEHSTEARSSRLRTT